MLSLLLNCVSSQSINNSLWIIGWWLHSFIVLTFFPFPPSSFWLFHLLSLHLSICVWAASLFIPLKIAYWGYPKIHIGFPHGEVVKNLSAHAGDSGDARSIPGLGRYPGGGNSNPLQCSCLGIPMDRGAWRAIAHGVAESEVTEYSAAKIHINRPGLFCSVEINTLFLWTN